MPVTIEKLSELSNYDAPVPVVMGPGDSNIPSIAMMPGRLRCTEAVQWLLASGLHVVAIILGGISCLWLLQVAAAPMTGGSTRGKRGTRGYTGRTSGKKFEETKFSCIGTSYQNISILVLVSKYDVGRLCMVTDRLSRGWWPWWWPRPRGAAARGL